MKKKSCHLINHVKTTPPKWLDGLSWNFVGMFLRIPNCTLFTAPKRLWPLNSNLLTTIPPKPLNELIWNFVRMFLRIHNCANLLSFCVTAPKRLRRLNSNLLTKIPHKPLRLLKKYASTSIYGHREKENVIDIFKV